MRDKNFMIKEMPEEEKKYLNDVFYTDKDVEHFMSGTMPTYDIEQEKEFLEKLEKKGVKLSEQQKKEYLESFRQI